MKRIVGLVVLVASIAILLVGSVSNSSAITSYTVSVTGGVWSVQLTGPFTEDGQVDGVSYDYFCVVCYNSNGTLSDIDFRRVRSSLASQNASADCDGIWPNPDPVSAILVDVTVPWSGSENTENAAIKCNVPYNINSSDPVDTDADDDGVDDPNDECPNTPAGAGVNGVGCPDTDGDGFFDNEDSCPAVAGVAPDGCPPVDTDEDDDGVDDVTDQCPSTPAGAEVNGVGCPDTDEDGFFDNEDSCPVVPGVAPDGCPLDDTDADDDGVDDTTDQCPNTPAGAAVNGVGCPDTDGDGFFDNEDSCPAVPGVAPDGCPEEGPTDTDGDGVSDEFDDCPETPQGTEVNRRGCARKQAADPEPEPAPVVAGCDVTMGSPADAVGGTILTTTWGYWMPDLAAQTNVLLDTGKTAKVLGLDASGEFFLIVWNCSYLWVPVGTVGPTYDNVWNGTPLPTTVVG